MVLRNFDLQWNKRWYYNHNYGPLIEERKHCGTLPKTLIYNGIMYGTKIYVSKTKIMELCFTIEKLCYFGKNYGTMAKPMKLIYYE